MTRTGVAYVENTVILVQFGCLIACCDIFPYCGLLHAEIDNFDSYRYIRIQVSCYESAM
jgi:hypothetical protein